MDSRVAVEEAEVVGALVRAHPGYAAREAAAAARFELDERRANLEALEEMRELIPANVARSDLEMVTVELAGKLGVPAGSKRLGRLVNRIWTERALWLVHSPHEATSKTHVADLRSRYGYYQLDITELRAVYAALPVDFDNDRDGAKRLWREELRERLREAVRANDGLPRRHSAYAVLRNASYTPDSPFNGDARDSSQVLGFDPNAYADALVTTTSSGYDHQKNYGLEDVLEEGGDDYLDGHSGAYATAPLLDWVECFDENYGRSYYYNRATNESRWTPPEDADFEPCAPTTTTTTSPEEEEEEKEEEEEEEEAHGAPTTTEEEGEMSPSSSSTNKAGDDEAEESSSFSSSSSSSSSSSASSSSSSSSSSSASASASSTTTSPSSSEATCSTVAAPSSVKKTMTPLKRPSITVSGPRSVGSGMVASTPRPAAATSPAVSSVSAVTDRDLVVDVVVDSRGGRRTVLTDGDELRSPSMGRRSSHRRRVARSRPSPVDDLSRSSTVRVDDGVAVDTHMDGSVSPRAAWRSIIEKNQTAASKPRLRTSTGPTSPPDEGKYASPVGQSSMLVSPRAAWAYVVERRTPPRMMLLPHDGDDEEKRASPPHYQHKAGTAAHLIVIDDGYRSCWL